MLPDALLRFCNTALVDLSPTAALNLICMRDGIRALGSPQPTFTCIPDAHRTVAFQAGEVAKVITWTAATTTLLQPLRGLLRKQNKRRKKERKKERKKQKMRSKETKKERKIFHEKSRRMNRNNNRLVKIRNLE